jgi:hypothetical protein
LASLIVSYIVDLMPNRPAFVCILRHAVTVIALVELGEVSFEPFYLG